MSDHIPEYSQRDPIMVHDGLGEGGVPDKRFRIINLRQPIEAHEVADTLGSLSVASSYLSEAILLPQLHPSVLSVAVGVRREEDWHRGTYPDPIRGGRRCNLMCFVYQSLLLIKLESPPENSGPIAESR